MSNNLISQKFERLRVSQVSGSLRSGRAIALRSDLTTQVKNNDGLLSSLILQQSHDCPLEHCYGAWSTICPSTIVNTTFTFSIATGSIG
jgi:hypothetical protein